MMANFTFHLKSHAMKEFYVLLTPMKWLEYFSMFWEKTILTTSYLYA